jgi:hypothetical protein
MNAVIATPPTSIANIATAQEIKAQVHRIQQVMKAVMKKDVHYGIVPGTQKPSLWKPGAEVLCVTFRIAPKYRVEDLSDGDTVRYRVTCIGEHQGTGIVLGEGMGEASSSEEKYKWRDAVCDEEFNETDDDRKRVKWNKGAWDRDLGERKPPYTRKQVRTEPADVGNTVLKMACKRAQIAMSINCTAAGDIFSQDLEDLPEGMLGSDDAPPPSRTQKPSTSAPRSNGAGGGFATEKQVKLIGVKLDNAGMSVAELCARFKIEAIEKLPFGKVNEALAYIADPEREAIQGE